MLRVARRTTVVVRGETVGRRYVAGHCIWRYRGRMTPTSARMFAEAMRAREHACVHLDAAPPAARLRSSPSWSSAGRKQADWTYSNIFRGNTISACVTWWRNGSAFDSRSKGWGFDSLSRHALFCQRFFVTDAFLPVYQILSRGVLGQLLFFFASPKIPSPALHFGLDSVRFPRQNSSSASEQLLFFLASSPRRADKEDRSLSRTMACGHQSDGAALQTEGSSSHHDDTHLKPRAWPVRLLL